MKKRSLILIGLIFSNSLLFAGQNAYLKNDGQVFLTPNAKKEVGKIDTATPVEVLNEKGNFKKVKVSGWAAYGFENVLFKDVGKRIFYLVLDDNKTIKPQILGEKTDTYDTVWKNVSYTFWVKKESLSKDIDSIYAKGKELFTNRCGACHAAPELEHYTVNQWPSIINSMKPRAGLTDEDMQFVVKFVQKHGK
ncbi:hypothetical protein [Malaciobacter marinus]|jgi:trimethylamine-N-oxide reductase cytochrome c-type subunit TorC|uniref:hypothetical protein n=1 Tax=Malaciobacter marinus TaxID=505249 RepID=UPI0009A7F275|nr:hypothetical protein [Malaciobacter marinus]SKB46024.1 hypothetical protein SAMN06295997_11351 [Malaciobacter marinus]